MLLFPIPARYLPALTEGVRDLVATIRLDEQRGGLVPSEQIDRSRIGTVYIAIAEPAGPDADASIALIEGRPVTATQNDAADRMLFVAGAIP